MGYANISRRGFLGLMGAVGMSAVLGGCASTDPAAAGKTQIEVVTYKQEAVDIFKQLQDKFNATHDDIYLKITCPNDAITIIKTRFIRNNFPDIIGTLDHRTNESRVIDNGRSVRHGRYRRIAASNRRL